MVDLSISWRAVWAVWMRNYTVYSHTWMLSFVPRVFEPLIFFAGFGLGLGAFIGEGIEGVPYIAFVGPGLLASAAMYGASYETTWTMFVRRQSKIYDAYLNTPAQTQDFVLGEVLWATTRAWVYGTIYLAFLGVFTWLGYPILTSWVGALLILFGIFLVGFLFSACGALATALIPVIDIFAVYYTMFILPIFLFSGIFFPLSKIPHGEAIAWFTPLYHGVRLLRNCAQGKFGMEIWVSLLWMAGASIVLLILAIHKMKKRMVS